MRLILTRRKGASFAFTIIELLLVISISTLLVSLLLPALADARRVARQQLCASSMRQIGITGNAYASDHRDRLFSYSWKYQGAAATYPIEHDDIAVASQSWQDDLAAQCGEFTQALRSAGATVQPVFGAGFFPYRYYSLVPLASYGGVPLPSRSFTCPSDSERLRWIDQEYFESQRPVISAELGEPMPGTARWRMSSSYSTAAATFQPDTGRDCLIPVRQLAWGSLQRPLRLGGRRLTEVSFPSSKVWVHDWHDRHSRKMQTFFADRQARQPLLMLDGSVSERLTADSHRGASPHFPDTIDSSGNGPRLYIFYNERQPSIGQLSKPSHFGNFDSFYAYTQGGLRGIDFGGTPIDTRTLPD